MFLSATKKGFFLPRKLMRFCLIVDVQIIAFVSIDSSLQDVLTVNRGGARGGLGGDSPRRKVKHHIFGDFWHL